MLEVQYRIHDSAKTNHMLHTEAVQHGGVLLRLRQATHDHHDALEQRLGLATSFTRSHYVRVLQGFDAFLQSWEELILPSVPTRLKQWAREGMRHRDLRQDMEVLGIEPVAPARLGLQLPTRAAAMGSLYVMEGSLLGARVIAPRLANDHELHAGNGARYFAADPDRAAARWRDFRFLLEQELATPSSTRQACQAACSTFQALLAVFEPHLQEDAARAS